MARHPGAPATTGRRVRGYQCPACGEVEDIRLVLRLYSSEEMRVALMFSTLAVLGGAGRPERLRCERCGNEFAQRTSLLLWWFLWFVLLVAGAVVAFMIGNAGGETPANRDFTRFMLAIAETIQEHPVATALTASWMIVFPALSLMVLSYRVRRRLGVTIARPADDDAGVAAETTPATGDAVGQAPPTD